MKTITIQSILVPFRFNEEYYNSIKVAIELSKQTGAKLTILNVNHPLVAGTNAFGYVLSEPLSELDSTLIEKRRAIQELLTDSGLPVGNVEIRMEMGSFNSVIVNLSKSNSYDLIVVPDFNRHFFGRMFAELEPLDLISRTKKAVIAVNKDTLSYHLNRIVLPIRNVGNWFHKVPFIASLAKITGAQLSLLGISEKNSKTAEGNLEKKMWLCMEYLKRSKIVSNKHMVYGNSDVYKQVLAFSENQQADLIAVSPPSEHSSFKSYFNSYFFNQLVSKGNIPVLGYSL